MLSFKKVLLSLFLFAVAFPAVSQSITVTPRTGKVSMEEVAMKSFDQDTSAKVLVLWEDVDVEIRFDQNLNLSKAINRTIRVKVLKDAGKSYLDEEFEFSTVKGRASSIGKINVVTYNLENGKITQSKMPKNAIYRSSVGNDRMKVNFAPVDVRVGSVIEMSYEVLSDVYWELGTFYFQKNVPVNRSDLKVTTPDWLKFSKRLKGYEKVAYDSVNESVPVFTKFGDYTLDTKSETYQAVDLPAMHKDSNVYCLSQYMTAVEYNVTALQLPGQYTNFSSTWEDIDNSLRKSDAFKSVHGKCTLKSAVDEVIAGGESDFEKISKIRELVVKEAEGKDNADANEMFGAALNYAGYSAETLFIRKRSNGMIMDFSPKVGAFNTFVLLVTTPEKSYVIDANEKCGYFDLLDPEFLTENARLVTKEGGTWFDLSGCGNHMKIIRHELEILPEGTLHGKVSETYNGIASLEVKSLVKQSTMDEIAEMIESSCGVTVGEIRSEGENNYSSECSLFYDIEKNCTVSDGRVYVPLFIDKFHSKSDFKNTERVYPVDFESVEAINYNLVLTAPDGYAFEDIPSMVRVKFPPLSSQVQMSVVQSVPNMLIVNFQFRRMKRTLQVADYASLKEYWEFVCDLYDSMVTLKKAE